MCLAVYTSACICTQLCIDVLCVCECPFLRQQMHFCISASSYKPHHVFLSTVDEFVISSSHLKPLERNEHFSLWLTSTLTAQQENTSAKLVCRAAISTCMQLIE